MNIGWELSQIAAQMPEAIAVVEPAGRCRDQVRSRQSDRSASSSRSYRTVTFSQLDQDSTRIAAGLREYGVRPGTRLALLVRPGIDFVSLVFALFKSGAVTILIDPGMGRRNLVRCLQEANPAGLVAISLVQAIRTLRPRLFPAAQLNVTVGARWFWSGRTLGELRQSSSAVEHGETGSDDPAAIIFTTGSTGPPKGVLYRHGNFAHQVSQIRDRFDIRAGEIDLPGFPLFALFNSVMGVTTVFPEMDFTRPAQVNPQFMREHADDWQPTQSFGSPALWNTVGKFCEQRQLRFSSIRRVLSAGAPVPAHVLRRVKAAISPDGEVFTPYGATEALPVASISANEVLQETAAISEQGGGTCVGRRFSQIEWRVIKILDEPIESIDATQPLSAGVIGELIVRGPVVTTEYVTRTDANALAKIRDGDTIWHRMGDCGYLDEFDRFWFCGRKGHRVITSSGTMFTVPCEAIASRHKSVYRSALVGIGIPGRQVPVMLVETWPENRPRSRRDRERLLREVGERLRESPLTREIAAEHVLWHPSFPVDIRHNAKIFREQLGPWAAKRLRHIGHTL